MMLLSLLLATAPMPSPPPLSAAVIAVLHNSRHGTAIPAWARKYNMNCSGCHLAAVPRLNATGVQFKWSGYRMPEEIGEDIEVQRVSNYLATRSRFRYEYDKVDGEPAEENGFQLPDATVFYGGAFGKNFGGFFEVAKEDENAEFGAQMVMVWGSESRHGGLRLGQTHMLLNSGLAGLDRPIGIAAPMPVAQPITSAIPFSYAGDQAGVEGFFVVGRNRIGVQVIGGTTLGGEGLTRSGTTKDLVVSDQLLLGEDGSGIMGSFYTGSVALADVEGDVNARFWRFAVTANKVVGNFEAVGGAVVGRDIDLPVGGIAGFSSAENRGFGYWFAGHYTIPGPTLTIFGRWEYVDPNTRLDDDARRRLVVGGVLPINLPEYLRLAAEFRRDIPQLAALARTSNLALELMLSF